jgi:hypothetical protein
MAAPAPVATAINTYSRLYEETSWAAHSLYPGRIIREFAVPIEGIMKSGPQLYEDVKTTWNETPHVYVMLVKEDRRIVFLHQATLHNTPLGTTPEPWNDKLSTFTGDVVSGQIPQAVLLPMMVLAMTNQAVWSTS